jgi:hypothetical protein
MILIAFRERVSRKRLLGKFTLLALTVLVVRKVHPEPVGLWSPMVAKLVLLVVKPSSLITLEGRMMCTSNSTITCYQVRRMTLKDDTVSTWLISNI